MTISYVCGDLFTSKAQTLAHGVNAAGRMRAGIADEFRLRYPEMYQEYRRLCHRQELSPGGAFLWRASEPWVLNLVTQEDTKGARLEFVRESLLWLAARHRAEGLVSVAMPRIAAGLGGLNWEEVRQVLEEVLGPSDLPVTVYEKVEDGEQEDVNGGAPDKEERPERAVFFGKLGSPRWRPLSNFHPSPITIGGRTYATVEHFFQASKGRSEADHELVRAAASPASAKRLGRRLALRPDWDRVKRDVMREGLIAKFTQHPSLAELLLSTGSRPIHEDSRWDDVWGWAGGEGQDLLGKLLVEVRERLARI